MLYIGNAFSGKMIKDMKTATVKIDFNVDPNPCVYAGIPFVGCIGHKLFAARAAKDLKLQQESLFHRVDVAINPGDQLLVFQYLGPRLEEGATEIPEDAPVQWDLYTVLS